MIYALLISDDMSGVITGEKDSVAEQKLLNKTPEIQQGADRNRAEGQG